jgi:hypothetical protein
VAEDGQARRREGLGRAVAVAVEDVHGVDGVLGSRGRDEAGREAEAGEHHFGFN